MRAGRAGVEGSALFGLLLVSAAATLWGTVGIATRLPPDGLSLSSLDLGFARLATAAPLLVLFSAVVLGRALWAIDARAWPGIAAVGALAAGSQFCLFVSLGQLGVATTALVTVCLPPMLIAGGSALLLRRRPSTRTCGAFLLALLGLVLLGGRTGANEAGSGAAPLLGLASAILGAVGFASFSGLARALTRLIHPLQVVTFGFVVGAVLLAPVVALGGTGSGATVDAATLLHLLPVLLYLGAGPTALAYICYFYGMRLEPDRRLGDRGDDGRARGGRPARSQPVGRGSVADRVAGRGVRAACLAHARHRGHAIRPAPSAAIGVHAGCPSGAGGGPDRLIIGRRAPGSSIGTTLSYQP